MYLGPAVPSQGVRYRGKNCTTPLEGSVSLLDRHFERKHDIFLLSINLCLMAVRILVLNWLEFLISEIDNYSTKIDKLYLNFFS